MKKENVKEKVLKLLESSHHTFQVIDHLPAITAFESSKVEGSRLDEIAKSLVLIADKNPLLAIVAGDRWLDAKKLKKTLKIKDLRFATSDEVETYTSCPIGSVPPFGMIFTVPVVIDSVFEKRKEVVFSAGTNTTSIRMKAKDFLSIVSGRCLSFTVPAPKEK